jgi:hypothetical protein
MNTRFVKSGQPGLANSPGVAGEAAVEAEAPVVRGMKGDRFWARWPVPVLILAVLLAHGMALNADFYMDDHAHILLRETGKVAEGMHYGYRWVTGLAWDGIYAAFGASSVAFHAFNVLLHMAVTVSVYVVGRRLVRRVAPRDQAATAEWAAFAGALFFGTHPVLTEGVNYAQNASLQLVTLFTVWAVGFSLRFFDSGQPRWALAVIGCLGASAFTKEVGLIYSGLSAALVWAAIGGRDALALVRSHRERLRWCLVAAVPIVAYSLWYGGRLAFHAVQAPMWVENFFTQGRLFWAYVGLIVWPADLCADHLVPFSGVGLVDPVSLAATVAVGGVAGLLVLGLRHRAARTACLLLLLGIIPMVMRFMYVNRELFVEYRMYAAFPWIALAAGYGVAWLLRWTPRFTGVALFLTIGLFTAASARRSLVWSDAYQLALDSVRQYPAHVRGRTHLQRFELASGNWNRVLELRDQTLSAFEQINAYNNSPASGRKYEIWTPYQAYLCSEHFAALALTERDGSQRGLQHAAKIIEFHRRLNPELFDPENNHHEVVAQIVNVHALLRDYGATYDQRRKQVHPASATDQAAK